MWGEWEQGSVVWLNNQLPRVIKFTTFYSEREVEFLDLKIVIENGKFKTNLHIKPSNLQLYLDCECNHPKHCKSGIVYGQALRIIERCTEKTDSDLHLENLKGKLLQRNYPENLISEQISRAKTKDRKALITSRKNKNNKI